MSVDRFGRTEKSVNFGQGFVAVEWDDSSVSGVTFLRGDYKDECLIQRIDGNAKTVTWAFGAWDDRVTLEYGTDEFPR